MDSARDEFLTGAGFARDEHNRICTSDLFHLPENFFDGFALATIW